MKNFYILILMFCLAVSGSANALKSTDANTPEYIEKHGHSYEIIRMMELQKARVEPEKPEHREDKTNNRFVRFFKNIFYERDLTMPLNDFGHDRVRTPEEPGR